MVSFVIIVSVWLRTAAGRGFKKRLESEKRQNERKDD